MTIELLNYLGAELCQETSEYLIFTSICHNSDSHKLYYYPQTNSFYCWSQCNNQVDHISLVQQVEGISFTEAIEWLMDFFQLSRRVGFGRPERAKHMSKIVKPKEINLNEKLPSYNGSILNTFYDIPPIEWLIEDISVNVMKQFGIKIDLNTKSIIIPCRDVYGNIVGIRQRNLDKQAIEDYGKYIIYTDQLSGITYKFPSSKVLYGLHENLKKIQECKQVILFEGEKSVLKSKTLFKDNDISIASFGCSLSQYHLELLKSLGVETLIFMYDREIEERILKKMEKVYKKSALLFNIYYIKDYDDLINEKESPIDRGENIYRELLNRIEEYELE